MGAGTPPAPPSPHPSSSEAASLLLPRSLALPPFPRIILLAALSSGSCNCPLSSLNHYFGACSPFCPSWVLPHLKECQRQPLPVMGYWAHWAASLSLRVSAYLFLYEHWALVYEMGALVPTQVRYWRTVRGMVMCKAQKRNQEVFWHCLLQGRTKLVEIELV